MQVKSESEVAQSCPTLSLLATPWTAAYQSPPSIGFSRQKYWSGVPLPSLWQLERASKDVMAQNTFPGGQVLVRIQKENLGMLEVPKEAWKADDGWMRGVSWDHIPAGNDIRHGDE